MNVASLKHAIIQGIHITAKLNDKIERDRQLLKERQAAQAAFEKQVVVRGMRLHARCVGGNPMAGLRRRDKKLSKLLQGSCIRP